MTRLRLLRLDSTAAIRGAAAAWDDLWWRSHSTRPIARAELVAQWIERFAPRAPVECLAVEERGQWVAALPLVRMPRWRVLRGGTLPWNEWSPGGDLLLDREAGAGAALDLLAAGLRKSPFHLLWLDGVSVEAPQWQALTAAFARAGMANECRVRWHAPLIEIGRDWEAFRQRWPKQHRIKMAKAERCLAKQGDVQFVAYRHVEPPQIEGLLRRAFEVEDRSWKGGAGTAVLRTPGMFDFFLRQAVQLAEWGQLEVALLEVDGRAVAFVYGFTAKGVSCWHKIGYDPEFRSASPGQLLQCRILEGMHADPESRAVDCMGPMSHALSRWKPDAYPVGRLIVAPCSLLGRIALGGYKHCWPPIVRLLGRRNAETPPSAEAIAATARESQPVEVG